MTDIAETLRLREAAIQNFYAAERRARVSPEQAYERMEAFAQRLDDLAQRRATGYIYMGLRR